MKVNFWMELFSLKGMFWLFLTITVFMALSWVQRRVNNPFLNPTMLSILVIIAILAGFGIPYVDYSRGGNGLTQLLNIAVVALGVPLYKQVKSTMKELPQIILIVAISSTLALISTVLLALLCGSDGRFAMSLAARSVTTPIAVMITDHLGGIPTIAAVSVIFTGLVGAVIGVPLINLLNIRHPKARGVAMGVASHVMGTSRISEECAEQGAYSALALVISAITSALLAPFVVPVLIGLFS